jgi:hypothetical protein
VTSDQSRADSFCRFSTVDKPSAAVWQYCDVFLASHGDSLSMSSPHVPGLYILYGISRYSIALHGRAARTDVAATGSARAFYN